ncbi:endocuticle structural glycoprotein SgAbd-5-like [Lycorma delicatula]|uniref:endocuticle structural glycoprotein SgAbd-5-like n=1 Tax=Lycorma delicatula TaxID=130591 RepID=UPI003F517B98
MYSVIFAALILGVSVVVIEAAPQAPAGDYARSQVVSEYNEVSPDGGYKYGFETDLGIKKDEVGTLKAVPGEGNAPAEPAIVAQGSYSYRGADGKLYKVEYTADENGFNPKFTSSR